KEKKIEKKEEILPHGAKKIEDYKHLQYSLIVNKDFNIADKIERELRERMGVETTIHIEPKKDVNG
ncbi:MAG: hypothetical protein II027_01485, partial [Bacteroidales bacterium]|nr:hypothetical protein [Bacteroidales bacterium]